MMLYGFMDFLGYTEEKLKREIETEAELDLVELLWKQNRNQHGAANSSWAWVAAERINKQERVA